MSKKYYRYAEIFCGAGGLTLGALRARSGGSSIVPVWSLDIDPDACNTYRHNIGNHVVCMDARNLNPVDVPDHDGLGFGFPCNDFSNVGEQKGMSGNYGRLYRVCVDVLDFKKPIWWVAENVDGLSSADNNKALPKIIGELAGAGDGYSVCAHLYKFEEYGIPQMRHRIIIVGVRSTLAIRFNPPAPSGKLMGARDALECPPIPYWAGNQELTTQSIQVVQRLSHIPPGKNAWCEEVPSHLRLRVKGARLSQIYRRLEPGKPAYTLTASGGGGTHMYHWNEPRALTNRERARIQTFPDDYLFLGKKESVRKQIGMAVSPAMSEIIFRAVLMTMNRESYDSVRPNLIFG